MSPGRFSTTPPAKSGKTSGDSWTRLVRSSLVSRFLTAAARLPRRSLVSDFFLNGITIMKITSHSTTSVCIFAFYSRLSFTTCSIPVSAIITTLLVLPSPAVLVIHSILDNPSISSSHTCSRLLKAFMSFVPLGVFHTQHGISNLHCSRFCWAF